MCNQFTSPPWGNKMKRDQKPCIDNPVLLTLRCTWLGNNPAAVREAFSPSKSHPTAAGDNDQTRFLLHVGGAGRTPGDPGRLLERSRNASAGQKSHFHKHLRLLGVFFSLFIRQEIITCRFALNPFQFLSHRNIGSGFLWRRAPSCGSTAPARAEQPRCYWSLNLHMEPPNISSPSNLHFFYCWKLRNKKKEDEITCLFCIIIRKYASKSA